MRTLPRLGAALAAVVLATVTAVAVASPASARISLDGFLDCESGGHFHYSCHIEEPNNTTNQVWKYNGSHIVAFDGHSSVYGACAPNLRFSIGVTYSRPDGSVNNTGMTINCLEYWQ